MKEKIYKLLDGANLEGESTDFYDSIMMVSISLSMIPLMIKDAPFWTLVLDWSVSTVFIVDYLLRWWTADQKMHKGFRSYILYPFTPMAIVDLLSILPVFTGLASGFRLLRLSRFLRTFRVFRGAKP